MAAQKSTDGCTNLNCLAVCVLILLGAGALAFAITPETGRAARTPQTASAYQPPPPEKPSASMDELNAISPGMTYSFVCSIIGGPGELISESSIDFPGSGPLVTRMYVWYGPNGISNMNAMFQNDKLVSKAQLGLK